MDEIDLTSEKSPRISSNVIDEDVDDPEIVDDPKATAERNDVSVPSTSGTSITCTVVAPTNVDPIISPACSGVSIKLHNVVASVDLKCKLDLMKISLRTRNSEYNPRRFHALVMRIWEPRTAALIFRSGKIVVTGGKSESGVHLAARKYARILQKLSYDVQFADFKIQNMVASCDVRFPIMLEKLYTNQVQFSNYEPEIFPGVIYRMIRPRVVLLIFVSGKMVLTGAKNRGELTEAFDNIYPVLCNFRKQ